MSDNTVQLREKGVLTLPIDLRRKYNLRPGDVFTLVELGDGGFLLSLKSSRLAALGDKVAEILDQEGVSVEEVLQTLDEERERYYAGHYAGKDE
jgi:bifunctional DNA-binding transcriptional regulator/antitoxin component of YhaV-PrlF toxin-antitoxin module